MFGQDVYPYSFLLLHPYPGKHFKSLIFYNSIRNKTKKTTNLNQHQNPPFNVVFSFLIEINKFSL